MSQNWLPWSEAAASLGVDMGTLYRRIRSGEVQSRLVNGRREVLVDFDGGDVGDTGVDPAEIEIDEEAVLHETIVEEEYESTVASDAVESVDAVSAVESQARAAESRSTASPFPGQPVETPRRPMVKSSTINKKTMATSSTVQGNSSDTRREQLSYVWAEVRRAQRSARVAWGVVALMLLATVGSVCWNVWYGSEKQAEMELLQQQALNHEGHAKELSRILESTQGLLAKRDDQFAVINEQRESMHSGMLEAKQSLASVRGELEAQKEIVKQLSDEWLPRLDNFSNKVVELPKAFSAAIRPYLKGGTGTPPADNREPATQPNEQSGSQPQPAPAPEPPTSAAPESASGAEAASPNP